MAGDNISGIMARPEQTPDRIQADQERPLFPSPEEQLHRTWIEVLAEAGISFETGFKMAEIVWDIHQVQLKKREEISRPMTMAELLAEEEERHARERDFSAISEEERLKLQKESLKLAKRVKKNPEHEKNTDQAAEQVARGEHFSLEVTRRGKDIPKLKEV